jgi:exonuclease VII large subunit
LFVLDRAKDGLIVKQRLVRAVDPTNALQRGFALVFSPDNRLLISVATIKKNEKLVVKMKDGTINTKVEEIDPK